MTESVIVKKTYSFAPLVVQLCRQLQLEFVLSKQLLRSGTSVGADVTEAMPAESKADFIHKMSIALKETAETDYWLRLLNGSETATNINGLGPLGICYEVRKIITSIIKTSKERGK